MPNDNLKKPSPGLAKALERFIDMMGNFLKAKELEGGAAETQALIDSMRSTESILNYMVDNFVTIDKKDISGISGFLCNNCLAFQFHYIKDIGFDLTANTRHRCIPSKAGEANKLQNKIQIRDQIFLRAINCLIDLTNSIFIGKKYLAVDSSLDPTFLTNFQAPLIKLDSISPGHWAWKPIVNKIVKLTDVGLKNFIGRMEGTYALIFIENGAHSGYHLMYIRRP